MSSFAINSDGRFRGTNSRINGASFLRPEIRFRGNYLSRATHSLIVPETATTFFLFSRVAARYELLNVESARLPPLTPPTPTPDSLPRLQKLVIIRRREFLSSFSFFRRPLEFASARARTSMQMAWALCTVAVNSLTSYSSSKQKGNYFHSGRKVPNEASYCSDGSRSDCCFVSLTRNVCQVSGSRFSDRPVALCNHKRLLMPRGKHKKR